MKKQNFKSNVIKYNEMKWKIVKLIDSVDNKILSKLKYSLGICSNKIIIIFYCQKCLSYAKFIYNFSWQLESHFSNSIFLHIKHPLLFSFSLLFVLQFILTNTHNSSVRSFLDHFYSLGKTSSQTQFSITESIPCTPFIVSK